MALYIEDDLRIAITADATLSALIPSANLYPSFIRSDARFPCLCLSTVGSSRERTFDDTVAIMRRIQFDAFAVSFPQVKEIEGALCSFLDGFTGFLIPGSTFRVIECVAETILDSWQVDSSVFRTMVTFEITYS